MSNKITPIDREKEGEVATTTKASPISIGEEINRFISFLTTVQQETSSLWEPSESSTLDSLYSALAKAQTEMKLAELGSKQSYYGTNYASLSSVIKSSRPALTKNGLCVIQNIKPNRKGEVCLFTRLCHSSGEWIQSCIRITPEKNDIQSFGKYITYLRRYAYGSLVGVITDEDDDGETEMKEVRSKDTQPKKSTISRDQLQILSRELEGHPDILERILKGCKIGKLSEMPASRYAGCIDHIRSSKEAKEAKGGK